MTLTVACVWVNGHVPYHAEYVTRLHAMVLRWVDEPVRFVCLTDRPQRLPSWIETMPIRLGEGLKGWWAKLELFNPARAFVGRVLYLDLDVLIVRSLAPIVSYPAAFALAANGAPGFAPKGFQTVPRFNSSVMVWHGGDHTDLYTAWTPQVATRLWGDQDWIGERKPAAIALPLAWTPRLSEVQPPLPREARVILAKVPKNHVAAAQWAWVQEVWG